MRIDFYGKSALIFHYEIVVKIKCFGVLHIQRDGTFTGCKVSKQFFPVIVDAAIPDGDGGRDFSSAPVNESFTTVVGYF